MKSINVIDLDKTLIPFDSFRYLIIDEIKAFNFKIILLVTIRKLRIIRAERFKSLVIKTLKLDTNKDLNKKMADLIISSIDYKILDKINQESSSNNTTNILCSASADSYVKEVAKRLGWRGYGSYYKGKEFYHMYGVNKLKFIYSKFPNSKYQYHFAISDSQSDLTLLKQFKKYEFIIRR